MDEKKPEGAINEALQQCAFADKILLNKVDLVSAEEKAKVKARLATINKFAMVIETEKNRAPLEKILGLNSFNMESTLTIDPEFFELTGRAREQNDNPFDSTEYELFAGFGSNWELKNHRLEAKIGVAYKVA